MELEQALSRVSYSKVKCFFECSKNWEATYLLSMKSAKSPELEKGIKVDLYYEKLCNPDLIDRDFVFDEFKREFPLLYHKWFLWEKVDLPKGPNIIMKPHLIYNTQIQTKYLGSFAVEVFSELDYLNLNNQKHAYIVDFKTGKTYNYSDQLAFYSWMTFNTYPEVEEIDAFIFNIGEKESKGLDDQNYFYFKREDDYPKLSETTEKQIATMIDKAKERKFYINRCIRCRNCPLLSCRYNKSNELTVASVFEKVRQKNGD